MLFREKLRELRLKRGLSQSELAKLADMPVYTLQNHEQGSRSPSFLSVCKLARALKVDISVFVPCAFEEEAFSATATESKPKRRKKQADE